MPTVEHVLPLAIDQVPKAGLQRLAALVVSELGRLHEGNIAAFRLRSPELRRWTKLMQQVLQRSHGVRTRCC